MSFKEFRVCKNNLEVELSPHWIRHETPSELSKPKNASPGMNRFEFVLKQRSIIRFQSHSKQIARFQVIRLPSYTATLAEPFYA